jgi:3-(3-hydroxy-phenyl)propionate hydroxylase
MAHFVHGRVVFAGDSAHLVSPFGARGCNGGVADVDNLVWKLDRVLSDDAPASLIQSYDYEAVITADENILNSSRSTDFMTPKTTTSRAFRDAILELAGDYPFARPFVNSGRLSTAVSYPASPLSTDDEPGECWAGIRAGAVALDAPAVDGWLLTTLAHGGFTLMTFHSAVDAPSGVRKVAVESWGGNAALIVDRYDLQPGSAYLIRPDQYVAARWRQPTLEKVRSAFERARGFC